jgi:recombinational DNA repair ATPase RecF
MKVYGNLKVVCEKHSKNRTEFLTHLKRWVKKYEFNVVSEKKNADAILQGDLSIDDNYTTRVYRERERET